MDNVERLMEFGLTRHEASLYILLTLEGSLNGYEAAKQLLDFSLRQAALA